MITQHFGRHVRHSCTCFRVRVRVVAQNHRRSHVAVLQRAPQRPPAAADGVLEIFPEPLKKILFLR